LVVTQLKQHWRALKSGRPGRRFQNRYERNRETRHDQSLIQKSIQPVVGIILLAAGIVFCVIPGPGLPLVVLGAAVLSERSRVLARALDWTEVKLRSLFAWIKAWWRKSSIVAKNAIILLAAAAIASAGYGAYHVVFK
jgi:uncharacterized protein (TIGR02611 family)